jgi:serine/threonine protein kinase
MADENPMSNLGQPDRGSTAHLAEGFLVGGGRFSLLRELARGGMGVVWLAHDERLVTAVALKFLSDAIRNNPVALADLRRETQKSRMLSHPNIIRIYDLYEAPGEDAFISMEYVDGPSLWTLHSRQPRRCFCWVYLKPIMRQLCEALDYAHSEGVIHRDLKPANMLLDDRNRLRLADFGIAAKVFAPYMDGTDRYRASGTLSYMSPQQVDGKRAEVTDDIYALGAMLYELLSGHPPFYQNDVLYQVRNVLATPLSERLADLEVDNDVPAPVAALIMACLSKDPAKRPQSARAVADWIGLNEPSGATPASATVKTPEPAAPAPPTTDSEQEGPLPIEENETRRRLAMLAGAIGVGTMAWLAWTHLLPKMPNLPAWVASSNTDVVLTNVNAATNPVPVEVATASPPKVLLGKVNHESGLRLMDWSEGGTNVPAMIEGGECRVFTPFNRPHAHARARYYFQVLPAFRPHETVHARVKIEYHAETLGVMQLQFDGSDNEHPHYKFAGRKEFGSQPGWKTAYFELDNAVLRGGQKGGADFCLNMGGLGLYIRSVSLLIDK